MANSGLDSAVVERRLRPIYDALEVGNSKKALHEAEKVLKKAPNLQTGRALKGVALMRLGRSDESAAIIDQIMTEKLIDSSTLTVLSFIFKETDNFDKICTVYERAIESDGTNEELLTQLFMSYGPIEDFAAQQRVAMQLYRLKQKSPYYCWAVVSCLLKAIHGADRDDPVKKKLSLELAQRMMEKMIGDDKLDAEQEAQLYLLILQHQSKHTEQLAFLESTVGKKAFPGAPIEQRIELMEKLKQWPAMNVMLKKLLNEQIDRWDLYRIYIRSVAELVNAETKPSDVDDEERPDTSYEMCYEFLSELIEKSNKKYRGPYLARLELYRTMEKNKFDARKILGEFIELLVDYFRVFGEKPCCSKDIVLFLDELNVEQRPDLASKLIQLCNISSTTLPRTKEQMQRHICSLQISRICGAHSLSADHLTALYTAFTLHYEHGLNAFDTDMLPTDIPTSDSYALLAVYVMYDLALKLQTSNHMVEALCLLNYLQNTSPSNFHAKLLCMQLYHRIGCSWGAQKMYEAMNLKFIQLDSMGYLHCARLALSGLFVQARNNYETTLKFYSNNVREGHEFKATCYKYGSFAKLEDIMDFHKRLKYSAHFALTSLDVLINDLVCSCAMGASFDQQFNAFKMMAITCKIEYDKLCDNRDLAVTVNWDPRCSPDADQKVRAQSFAQDLDLIRIRNTLLRLISICVETVTKETYDKKVKRADMAALADRKCDLLATQLELWAEVFAEIRAKKHERITNEFLVNILPSRLHGHFELPYEQVFSSLGRLILSLEQRLNEPIEGVWKKFDTELMDLSQLVCDTVKAYNNGSDLLWNRQSVQETIVQTVEIFGLVCFVMSVAHERYMAVLVNRGNKRNKKKAAEENVSSAACIAAITSIMTRLKTELNLMDVAVESLKKPTLAKSLTETLKSLSLNPNVETIVDITISKSHEIVVDEIRTVLKDKLRALNALGKFNL